MFLITHTECKGAVDSQNAKSLKKKTNARDCHKPLMIFYKTTTSICDPIKKTYEKNS